MPEIQHTPRILQPGDEAALEAFLEPRLETSLFLLSNSRRVGLADSGQRFEGTYAAAFDGDDNAPAVAAYQAIGFRPIGDYRIVLVRQP